MMLRASVVLADLEAIHREVVPEMASVDVDFLQGVHVAESMLDAEGCCFQTPCFELQAVSQEALARPHRMTR